MNYKFTARNMHRDVAYFYIGLIISFSISGIALNHRATWNPSEYVVSSESILVKVPTGNELINEDFAKQLATEWNLSKEYQSFRVRGELVRVYFDGAIADFNINTGVGELEFVNKRPLLADMTTLHKTTNTSWIYYSDVFGAAMLLIAITGMFIAKGKESFKQRGWKFAIVGVLFPLSFLLFIY